MPSSPPTGSQLISKVLSPALGLWLRTQVERVEALQVQITGGDRQLLAGHIPAVSITAERAVYRGLHLSQMHLTAQQIRINLGQVLRGQPLRLLAPIPVECHLQLQEADLNASLQAPLLAGAIADLLRQFSQQLGHALTETDRFGSMTARIAPQRLTLHAQPSDPSQGRPLVLRTGLTLRDGHLLQLTTPQLLPHATAEQGELLTGLDGFELDLGADVAIAQLSLEDGVVLCQGRLMVLPEDTPSANLEDA